ncbi:hypothetical protein [Methylobacterium sp. ID0610]|uniref:hypothetical protein n=1 Tax=Methylobacterium carpenticola TaxID=3344827 RepID=UPI0036ADFB2A
MYRLLHGFIESIYCSCEAVLLRKSAGNDGIEIVSFKFGWNIQSCAALRQRSRGHREGSDGEEN